MENSKKKGLLVYDSIYGATAEVAYWIKDLIGKEHYLEVKRQGQVTTVRPFDYIIIGSYTRREKPSKATYAFVQKHLEDLSQKQVCYFLTCGDSDETQLLNIPGSPPHLIAGRNYFTDILKKFSAVKPLVIGGFGGRQVYPALHLMDRLTVDLVGKMAKESGAPWQGRDIWESLIPERVEVFAGEIREKILEKPAKEDVMPYRCYWQSILPAALSDDGMLKQDPGKYTTRLSTPKVYFSRSHIRGDFETLDPLILEWADQAGVQLLEQSRTFFNIYCHAVKSYRNKKATIHITSAVFPEDPGNVHVAFRCYEKQAAREGAEHDIQSAEKILWAEGRQVE